MITPNSCPACGGDILAGHTWCTHCGALEVDDGVFLTSLYGERGEWLGGLRPHLSLHNGRWLCWSSGQPCADGFWPKSTDAIGANPREAYERWLPQWYIDNRLNMEDAKDV